MYALLWFCCARAVDEHTSAVDILALGGFLAFIYKIRSKRKEQSKGLMCS